MPTGSVACCPAHHRGMAPGASTPTMSPATPGATAKNGYFLPSPLRERGWVRGFAFASAEVSLTPNPSPEGRGEKVPKNAHASLNEATSGSHISRSSHHKLFGRPGRRGGFTR